METEPAFISDDMAKIQIRKPYKVGNSTVVAIAPSLVRAFNIDATTFFEEEAKEAGIFLKIKRLTP